MCSSGVARAPTSPSVPAALAGSLVVDAPADRPAVNPLLAGACASPSVVGARAGWSVEGASVGSSDKDDADVERYDNICNVAQDFGEVWSLPPQ